MKSKQSSRPVRLARGIYLLPNLFTTAALFAGFYAVIVAMRGDFESAAIGILVAMVLDGMDGRVARLTHTVSDFGKEYDSMSDMVSFGLAPALVVYQWGSQLVEGLVPVWGRIGWLAAFFYTVAAALRLARFNSGPGSKNPAYFQGLPSPSAAGLVGSSLWLATEYNFSGPLVLASAFVLTTVAGALMVSNFPYKSFKDFDMFSRVGFRHLLLIPLVFMLIATDPPLVLSSVFFAYAVSGPLFYLWQTMRGTGVDLPPVLWFNRRGKNKPSKDLSDDNQSHVEKTGTGDTRR